MVGLVMGSQSDWQALSATASTLDQFEISYESLIVSAHRTPKRLYDYGEHAAARGLKVLIAGAGGAAHLPGMLASLTLLPVIGVPMKSDFIHGLDSMLSMVQMPTGVPVATVALGRPGPVNAALLAVSILALSSPELALKWARWRQEQTDQVALKPDQ